MKIRFFFILFLFALFLAIAVSYFFLFQKKYGFSVAPAFEITMHLECGS